MQLRISANYPATDGSMPESVEVEWTGDEGTVTSTAELLAILSRMMTINPFGSAPPAAAAPETVTATPADMCRRALCGHSSAAHDMLDDQDRSVGTGKGVCLMCGNADKCRSFVGGAA